MTTARRPLQASSQCSRILAWLVSGRTLTPLQALRKFGCLALSQRCGEIRRRGHDVRSRMVKVGDKRVALYWLDARKHGGFQ